MSRKVRAIYEEGQIKFLDEAPKGNFEVIIVFPNFYHLYGAPIPKLLLCVPEISMIFHILRNLKSRAYPTSDQENVG